MNTGIIRLHRGQSTEGLNVLQLPSGTTGLVVSSRVDIRAFRTVLYAAARDTGFTVDEPPPYEAQIYHTFVRSFVSFRDERWRLLLHLYHPFVAFTTPETDPHDFNFAFRDCDRLAANLFGYTVLTPDVLNLPVTEQSIALLHEFERKEIMNYWKPQTLGEIMFNFWD